jgi:hypothetical protein
MAHSERKSPYSYSLLPIRYSPNYCPLILPSASNCET